MTAPADDTTPARTSLLTTAAVAVVTGLAWATAHPAPGVWWLVLAVVPGWLTVAHLARHRRGRVVFGLGVLLGMSAFLPMLRWVALPATPLGWVLLATTQSLWVGWATVVVRRWTARPVVAAVGPLVWTGMEVVRARYPLSGFGWGDLASAHTDASWMLTVARVLGADGLTLLTALLGGCAWATVVTAGRRWAAFEAPERAPTVVPAAAKVVGVFDQVRPLVLSTIGVGVLGTLITAEVPPVVGQLDVLVVQGNDWANTEVGAAEDLRIAEAHADATIAAVAAGGAPDLTVWAENALDRDPWTAAGADLAPSLQRAVVAVDGDMLVGVIRQGVEARTFRNSMVAVDAAGEPTSSYDKRVVVPFGEYVPWREVIGELGPLTRVPRDAVPGDGPVTHDVAGARVATIICFETLFGDTVREAVAHRDAQLLVAATNDASFGPGAESAQHVAQSRLRAVETGRAVVHASIAGTSAIIDPDGRVLELAPLYEVATIRATVPLVDGRTPAAVVSPWLTRAMTLAWVGLAGLALVQGRRRSGDRGATATTTPGPIEEDVEDMT